MNEGVFILFGATGDLSRKRIIPALYALMQKNNSHFSIIGAGLEATTSSEILEKCKPYINPFDYELWRLFHDCFSYQKIDSSQSSDFEELAKKIIALEHSNQSLLNRFIYLAVPPQFFQPITQQLAHHSIIKKMDTMQESPWYRVAYEKPFGQDKSSALAINQEISKYLEEFQIFRVDHYLAKDIVGNIALVRFTNRIFEPLWNHENIDWIEIVLNETNDIGHRGAYYDTYGALKDVVQNHMLQLVALIAMEAPLYLTGDYIRDRKAEVLKTINVLDGILGQYEGYRNQHGVNADSKAETFAALKIMIDMPRWKNVPFYLRTGKALNKKETIINIQFKPVKCLLSSNCPSDSNYLTLRIMPEPGFNIVLNVKKPGLSLKLVPVSMDFCYECVFNHSIDNVYELILQEIITGEQSISVRFDEIQYSWDVIDQIEALNLPTYTYSRGSVGPQALSMFAQKNKMRWRL